MTQTSLFGSESPVIDDNFSGIERHTLNHGAWVDYCPGWLHGHQTLLEWLAESSDWQRQRRRMYDSLVDVPRLVAKAPSDGPCGRIIREASRKLSVRYQLPLTSVALAWYRDGADSVAMHGDKMGYGSTNTIIATVSTGEPRRFLMRTNDGTQSGAFQLGWGDLLVMGGTAQATWQHGVPKVAKSGPRISIIFRAHTAASPQGEAATKENRSVNGNRPRSGGSRRIGGS